MKKGLYSGLPEMTIAQIGPFMFLFALVFRPEVLTAAQSGDAILLDPLVSAAVSVGAMLVWGVVLLCGQFCPKTKNGEFPWEPIARFHGVLPIVALASLMLIRGPIIPPLVSILMGVTCVVQISLLSVRNTLNYRGTLLSAVLCLCISGVVMDAVYTLLPIYLFGSMAVCAALALSAVAIVRMGAVCDDYKLESLAGSPLEESSSETSYLMAWSLAAVVLGCLICSINLGLSIPPFASAHDLRSSMLFALGALLGAVLAFILFVLRKFIAAPDFILHAFAPALAFAVVLVVFSDFKYEPWYYVCSIASEFLFLSIAWTSALSLDRAISRPGILACWCILFFAASFIAFLALSNVIDGSTSARIFPLAALAFLLFLVAFASRKSSVSCEGASASLADFGVVSIIEQRCNSLAAEYGLSSRESELLHFFVLGMSSTAIGDRMFISPKTVKTHRYRVYQKMNVSTHEELVDLFGSIK